MQKAAIVILNYNGRKMLEQFIPSVIRFSTFPVYVADNASKDDSLEFLQQSYPQVKILALDLNHGFAGGYNQALAMVRGKFEYYILLNSDVAVTDSWDLDLIGFMDLHQKTVALQPKIVSYHNPDYFDYAGAAGGFLDGLGYPFCRGRIFDTIEVDQGQYNDAIAVDWASGACMAVRSEPFHQIGGFDPVFFAHMEEIDLCWRWRRQGYEISYLGEVTVRHLGGGTLHRADPHKVYLNFRNSLLMLKKNLRLRRFVLIYLLRLILDLLAVFRFFLRKNYKEAASVWKAHIDFHKFREIEPMISLASKLPPAQNGKKVLSIVWVYFVRGKKYYSEI